MKRLILFSIVSLFFTYSLHAQLDEVSIFSAKNPSTGIVSMETHGDYLYFELIDSSNVDKQSTLYSLNMITYKTQALYTHKVFKGFNQEYRSGFKRLAGSLHFHVSSGRESLNGRLFMAKLKNGKISDSLSIAVSRDYFDYFSSDDAIVTHRPNDIMTFSTQNYQMVDSFGADSISEIVAIKSDTIIAHNYWRDTNRFQVRTSSGKVIQNFGEETGVYRSNYAVHDGKFHISSRAWGPGYLNKWFAFKSLNKPPKKIMQSEYDQTFHELSDNLYLTNYEKGAVRVYRINDSTFNPEYLFSMPSIKNSAGMGDNLFFYGDDNYVLYSSNSTDTALKSLDLGSEPLFTQDSTNKGAFVRTSTYDWTTHKHNINIFHFSNNGLDIDTIIPKPYEYDFSQKKQTFNISTQSAYRGEFLMGYSDNGTAKIVKFTEKADQVEVDCFNDLNGNGKHDNNEPTFNELTLDRAGMMLNLVGNQEGRISFDIEKGKHEVTPVVPENWKLTTDKNIKLNNTFFSSDTSISVGLMANKNLFEIEARLGGLPTRCGFPVWTRPKYVNSGTKTMDGKMVVVLDSDINVDSFEIEPDTILTDTVFGKQLIWNFEDLKPTHWVASKIYYRVPGVSSIGDSLSFDLRMEAYRNDSTKFTLTDTVYREIRCAYDPNDKKAWPNRKQHGYQTLFDETLTYRIRFQNTGNDTAFNIKITDTLSSHLDWSTFDVTDYSHTVETKLHENGLVEFYFYDVLLPDSNVNEPESHGFIFFTIDPKNGLDENTRIENTAHIFFDFNPAIVTNTTENIMVSEIVGIRGERLSSLPLDIFPNPASHSFSLDIKNQKAANLKIMDLQGRILQNKQVSGGETVSVRNLSTGTYIIEVQQEEQVYRAKLLKR